jgi:gliding motility-associated-like protein
VYTVVGKTNNCPGASTINVAVQPALFITIAPGVSTLCTGSSLTLTSSGAASYTWLPLNTTGSAAIVSPSATSIYTVFGNLGACTASASALVNVSPLPALLPVASPSAICAGSSATLTASDANTYSWLPGNLSGGTVVVTPSLSTSYTVTGTNGSGCTSSSVIALLVTPVPTVSVISPSSALSSVTICPGNTVSLIASGASGYTWQPASSLSNSTGASVIASPAASTIYTVTGQQGACISTRNFTVLIEVVPTITITGSPFLCSGQTTTLVGAGSSNYTWMPGGINSSTISVNPVTTTIYTLTGSGSANCTSMGTFTLNVIPTPTLTVSAIPSQICPGQTATLSASGAANYYWVPVNLSQSVVTVSPAGTTVYTVIAAIAGCVSTETVLVQVNPLPLVNINASSTIACSGSTVTLTATGASSYQWAPGGTTGAVSVVSPTVTTSYTVTGANGPGCSANAFVTITVVPGPVISAFASPSVICVGAQAVLTASGSPVLTWQPLNVTGPTQSVNPLSTNVYTVSGTNTAGCTGTETVQVVVNPIPQITVNSTGLLLCAGESVTLSASGAGNYTWSPVTSNSSSVVVTPFVSAIYAVAGESLGCTGYASIHLSVAECSVTSFGVTKAAGEPILYNGNAFRINFTVTVVNSSLIDMTEVKLTDDLSKCFVSPCEYTLTGAPMILSTGSSLRVNSAFNGHSDPDLLSPSSSTLLAHKTDSIAFSVLVEPNGYSGTLKNSAVGFALMNSIRVSDSSNNGFAWNPDQDGDPTNNNEPTPIQIPFISLFIPEGFSPNGDGKYDYFEVKGTEGRPVKFTVFNRWGDAVYESQDTKVVWDGRANKGLLRGGGKLPASTYYYIFEFQDGKREVISGFIVLQY